MSESTCVKLAGLRIYGQRDGDHVTGRVEYPQPVCGRSSCPIDYKSRRPDPMVASRDGEVLSAREQLRLDVVTRYHTLREDAPSANRRTLARQVIHEMDGPCSVRSLQSWLRNYELDGVAGLRDRYTRPPKNVLTLDARLATDAVMIAAWWSFRIGNLSIIDNHAVHIAADLTSRGYGVADALATIDRYYSWHCDRKRYPFKPFGRWVRYDLDVWVLRACEQEDYRRGLAAARQQEEDGDTPLQGPTAALHSRATRLAPRNEKQRRRETNNRRTRSDLAALQRIDPNRARKEAVPNPNRVSKKTANSASPSPIRAAAMLQRIGLPQLARDVISRSGRPDSTVPTTLREALCRMDDAYRVMLIRAAQGDVEAREQAIATQTLWWPSMPQNLRNNIDFRINAWRSDHARVSASVVDRRRIDIFLTSLKSRSKRRRTEVIHNDSHDVHAVA